MIRDYIPQSNDLTNKCPLQNHESSTETSKVLQSPGCARVEKFEQHFLKEASNSDRTTIVKKSLSWDDGYGDTSICARGDQGTVLSSPFQPPAAYIIRKVSKLLYTGYSPRPIRAMEISGYLFVPCPKKPDLYYDKVIVSMIYSQDIDKLRQFHKQGLPFQISNECGDTLLHIACRYVKLNVVKFLVNEASVSLWVHDERGQTPLHCLCYSTDPVVFEAVDFILSQDVDLLFVADEEGFLPLDYAPRETWSQWVKFLRRKGLANFTPTRPCFFHMPPSILLASDNTPAAAAAASATAILHIVVEANRYLAEYAVEKKKEKKRRKSGNASFITLEIKAKQLKKTLCIAILKKIDSNGSQISKEEIHSFEQILTLPLDKLYDEFQTQRHIVRTESRRTFLNTP